MLLIVGYLLIADMDGYSIQFLQNKDHLWKVSKSAKLS